MSLQLRRPVFRQREKRGGQIDLCLPYPPLLLRLFGEGNVYAITSKRCRPKTQNMAALGDAENRPRRQGEMILDNPHDVQIG